MRFSAEVDFSSSSGVIAVEEKIAAWAVHGFTGSGAVLGFLAIISILNSDAVGAFLWLGLALLTLGTLLTGLGIWKIKKARLSGL